MERVRPEGGGGPVSALPNFHAHAFSYHACSTFSDKVRVKDTIHAFIIHTLLTGAL